MKRLITASSNSSDITKWIMSEEIDELCDKMTFKEQRVVARMANSKDPAFFLDTVATTLEFLGGDVSDAFDTFIREGLDKFVD